MSPRRRIPVSLCALAPSALAPCALAIVALGSLASCGAEEVGVVRMTLKPRGLDPALVDRVEIAVVGKLAQSGISCVSAVGSQVCADLSSVKSAEAASGHITTGEITRAKGGNTTSFSDLPKGRTCFIAEAFDAAKNPLASGCAEVEIRLETHKIEIEIASP